MSPEMFENLFGSVYSFDWNLTDESAFDVNIYSKGSKKPVDWVLNLKTHPKSFQNCLIFPFCEDLADDQLNIRLESNLYVRTKTRRNFKQVKPKKPSKSVSHFKADSKQNFFFSNDAENEERLKMGGEINLYTRPFANQNSPSEKNSYLDPSFAENLPTSFNVHNLPICMFTFDEEVNSKPTFHSHLAFRNRNSSNLFAIGLGNSLLLPKNPFSIKQKDKINNQIWKNFVNSDVTYNRRFNSWEKDNLDSLKQGGDFFRAVLTTLNRGLMLKPDRQLKSSEMKNSLINILPHQVATSSSLLVEREQVLTMKSFNTLKAMKQELKFDQDFENVLDRLNYHSNFRRFKVNFQNKRISKESLAHFHLNESLNESTKRIRENIKGNLQRNMLESQFGNLRKSSATSILSRKGLSPSSRVYDPRVNGADYYSFKHSDADLNGSFNNSHFLIKSSAFSKERQPFNSHAEVNSRNVSIGNLTMGPYLQDVADSVSFHQ